jgi:hypothetical protein
VDYEREKERRWEAGLELRSMKKEEKKKGKINEGDVRWVRIGSKNKEEKRKKKK